MYKRLLVAVDLSEISQGVFDHALALAQISGGEMLLLHILSPESENIPVNYAPLIMSYTPIMVEEFQKEWETFREQCKHQLEMFVRQAESQGVKVQSQQLSGHPGRLICEYAQEQQVDTIIIGRRGRSGLSELFLGSVSNYVLHHARCTVVIVQ